jgi:hypothetical protein
MSNNGSNAVPAITFPGGGLLALAAILQRMR